MISVSSARIARIKLIACSTMSLRGDLGPPKRTFISLPLSRSQSSRSLRAKFSAGSGRGATNWLMATVPSSIRKAG